MGVVHKPRLPMYWSTDSILATPIFNQVMRRDRFLLLVRFFHIADNTKYNPADPDRDKLYKIREVMNMIKDRCGKVYSHGKSLSMDESLVLFKGRLSVKRYISSKRARLGIKLYQLCTFNGILLDFIVYHGNLEPGLISLENCPLITERIPATVMQKYLNKGHHLFIDNYYTFISLAEYLMQNGTYIMGTIREHRKHFSVKMKALRLEKVMQHFTNMKMWLWQSIHLLINAPRLERPMKRTAVYSIARLTGRNHWPAKRETPAEWKDAKSRVKKCRVCTARGKKTKGGKEIKTTWICKGCPGEPGFCVDKECFELYHTMFDFSQ